MKSAIFLCFHGLEKWVHAFFNTFSWDFYEKEIHILEVTSFRLSYSNYYLNRSFLWDVLEESLLCCFVGVSKLTEYFFYPIRYPVTS